MGETLTLDTLEALVRAMSTPPLPEWAVQIRDAREVEVKPTEWVEAGMSYVVDPSAALGAGLMLQTMPTFVICHPQDAEKVRECVAWLRADPAR